MSKSSSVVEADAVTDAQDASALLRDKLQCPKCTTNLDMEQGASVLTCRHCGATYPVTEGRPVLLRPDNEIFVPLNYVARKSAAPTLKSRLARFVPSSGVDLAGPKMMMELRKYLDKRGVCSVLVIGCGQKRPETTQDLLPHKCVFTDVDPRAYVDVFCDGHDLPFRAGTFDAVVIHAVLEHVLDPLRVVSEIYRVLKPEGVVYSAVPFMQQVHEQAYDFTRFTLSGHRRLFRYFSELHSGMVAGPGTSLTWALEYFAYSFLSGRTARRIARVGIRVVFFWLKYFDYLCALRPEAMDAASGTYFMGIKMDEPVSDLDIIRNYVGTQCQNYERKKMMRSGN